MKKTFLLFLLPLAAMSVFGQNQPVREKKFNLGAGFGLGVSQEDPNIINFSVDLQGEYRAARVLSLYGSMEYHRLFTFNDRGAAGYGSLMAGPRVWFSDKFFAGMGAGVIVATSLEGGPTATLFNYNPHVGLNTKKAQYTIGYEGISLSGYGTGFIQVKWIGKIL